MIETKKAQKESYETLERLEKRKDEIADEMINVLDQLSIVKDKLIETLPRQEYVHLETQRRHLGRKHQSLAREKSSIGKELKKINRQIDLEERQGVARAANALFKDSEKRHIQWETFFVEAAKEYLSGDEFEIISKRASSKQGIRNA